MKEEFDRLPKSVRILNIVVLLFTYVAISISFVTWISPTPTPFPLKNWNQESLILLGVLLFLAAPFFSLLIFLLLLRVEQLFLTGKLIDWISPKPGTLANPVIDDIVGKGGIKVLNLVVKILVVLLVLAFAWIIYSDLRRF